MPSPLLYKGGLYFLKSNSGILTQLDAGSGAVRFMQRLEATPNVYASPVAAAGLIYIVGREGTTVVIEAGAHIQAGGDQRPRRAHRRVTGPGGKRDLHPRDEAPVPHLVVMTYANHRDTEDTEDALSTILAASGRTDRPALPIRSVRPPCPPWLVATSVIRR